MKTSQGFALDCFHFTITPIELLSRGRFAIIDYQAQLANLETLHSTHNSFASATALALRYWQASRFAANGTDARTFILKANHVALTAHRNGAAHADLYVLAIFIAIEAGHHDSANEMLDKAFTHRSFLRANAQVHFARLNFLYAYLEINQQRMRSAKKYWRVLTDKASTDVLQSEYLIMQGLLHLANNEFDDAFGFLREAKRVGSNSIFLHEGLYRYYCTTTYTHTDTCILYVLLYAASRGVDITTLATRHRAALFAEAEAHPLSAERLYTLSGYTLLHDDIASSLLQAICAMRIATGDVSTQAYVLYKEAESRQVAVRGLSQQLVYAAYACGAETISYYSLTRFLRESSMERDLAVYVYHMLLTTPTLAELAKSEHVRILQVARQCLAAGLRGREANALYYVLWMHHVAHDEPRNGEVETIEAIMRDNLTLFEIGMCANENVRQIYITVPERRGMTVIEKPEAETMLYIEAGNQNLSYTCLGAGGRELANTGLTIRRMIPGASMELYQYYFNRGDRRFYLLVFLTNYYLTQETPPEVAVSVFVAILEEKNLARAYKVRIELALGQLHYNASRFDHSLACYCDINEDEIEPVFITQLLKVYLQTGETERAVQLVAKRYQCLPHESLCEMLSLLLTQQVNYSTLAPAGYWLLIEGNNDDDILSFVLTHYMASYSEWVALARKIPANSHICSRVVETAIYTGAWDADMQYAGLCVLCPDAVATFVEYATYQLLANAATAEYATLEMLEHICISANFQNTLLTIALASCYLRHNIITKNSDDICNRAISAMEDMGLLLPVFKENRTNRIPFIEKYQPFLHRGQPGKNYMLYYCIDGAAFTSVPMQHIKYGMFTVCLPLFYNEEITYYFSEEMETGSITTKPQTIKNTTPFLLDTNECANRQARDCERVLTDEFFAINNAITYEQMFKHEEVERAVAGLIKEVRQIRSTLL